MAVSRRLTSKKGMCIRIERSDSSLQCQTPGAVRQQGNRRSRGQHRDCAFNDPTHEAHDSRSGTTKLGTTENKEFLSQHITTFSRLIVAFTLSLPYARSCPCAELRSATSHLRKIFPPWHLLPRMYFTNWASISLHEVTIVEIFSCVLRAIDPVIQNDDTGARIHGHPLPAL